MNALPLESPYPGLRPFKKHESPIFFGREPMIDAVVDRLAATQFVVVHGSSGCGKSSLIRAGVLPRLEQEHSHYGVRWRTAEMRPGSSPLWNLATTIACLVEKLSTNDEPTLATTRTIRRILNGGSDALSRIQSRFELGAEGNVCILLDQFEELFRYAREIGREEAEALIEVLRAFGPHLEGAPRVPPRGVHVIVTLRSGYLGNCGQFRGFAELVNATQYLLPRIRDRGEEALLRAIREPARLFGGEVSVDLALRLINDSRAEVDALPLIQHALMFLWRRASTASPETTRLPPNPGSPHHPMLTADTYDGLGQLLAEHAEQVLEEVATERSSNEKVTEYLFRAITEIDSEGRGVRRPRRRSQLVGATGGDETSLEQVIDRFCQPDCGFLVRSSGADPIIDIAHEALIRCWKKLDDPVIDEKTGSPRGWIQRERECERIWRSMLVQAKVGDQISPAVLKERQNWVAALPGPAWAERYDGGWRKIDRLLASSRNAAWRALLARAIAAVLVLLSVGVFSWWMIGVSPRSGMLMFASRVGLVNPGPEMIELPAGSFLMGSPEDEVGHEDFEGPQHHVNIPAFAISKYEVTFDEWDLCVDYGGCARIDDDNDWGRGRRPVVNVSWEEAQSYVAWLSGVTGEHYRLPTEAEWEYAARAQTTTPYFWGDSAPEPEQAITSSAKTTEVGSYPANPWGVHDMHGNVWEWVEDCWHASYEGAPNDGSAWTSGGHFSSAQGVLATVEAARDHFRARDRCDRRVLRGDRAAYRRAGELASTYFVPHTRVGFRVAKTTSGSDRLAR